MNGLRPFWRYYGGKWRLAPRYPAPRYSTIIEPFAGAAGYSLRYPDRRVILVEKYPTICEMWRFLIGASAAEIRRIPEVDDVRDLPSWVPAGGRALVGFSMNSAASTPRRTLSAGRRKMRAMHRQYEGWTDRLRERVASQVDRVRHWRIIEGEYSDAPHVAATWFVDPPYEGRPGSHYTHGSCALDYATLASWCRSRIGQAIVCEAVGATWLPFRSFATTHGVNGKRSPEAVWLSDEAQLTLGLEAG